MKFLIFCLSLIIFLFHQANSAKIINENEGEPKLGIVNGKDALLNEGKHVVELLFFGIFNCGGSLIDSTTVVSAAHCVDPSFFQRTVCAVHEFILRKPCYSIRYGSHKKGDSPFKVIDVKWTKKHPKYYFIGSRQNHIYNQRNDISILKLSEPVVEANNVEFIGLQQTELENTNGSFTLYGFGTIDVRGRQSPENLQKMSAYNVTEREYQEVLRNNFNHYVKVVPGTLLVRNPDAADCYGDSGSGLIYNNKLIAVVSGGAEKREVPSCIPGDIETFARVNLPENLEFIQENRR